MLASGLLALAVLAVAFTPLMIEDRDEVFAIPKGTYARRAGGDRVDILPNEVRLVLDVKDVLVLENQDDVPQAFGPVLLMPGQTFRLPFEMASSYQFACTAHASGQMSVIVAPAPQAGWERLAWRMQSLLNSKGTTWTS